MYVCVCVCVCVRLYVCAREYVPLKNLTNEYTK